VNTPFIRRSSFVLVGFLVVIVSVNLAWEHQMILTQQVTLKDYYNLAARAPFIYRVLPALIFRLIASGHINGVTGLKAPLDTYYGVYQLLLDAACLAATFIFMSKIAQRLNPDLRAVAVLAFAAAAELVIVVFGFFMVPNYAVFYPYDFPDMCCAAAIFYLCIRASGAAEFLLPIAVFVATLNKETAVFYSGLYLVFSIEKKKNWRKAAVVLIATAVAFLLSRLSVLTLLGHLGMAATTGGPQFENQFVSNTVGQLKNPLLYFALLNICSYLYVAVWAIRKRLDRTDLLILSMVIAWILIMSVVGVVRQLRLFVPASLLLYVILGRHLGEMLGSVPLGIACRPPQSTRASRP
jgi:hypothetical protein